MTDVVLKTIIAEAGGDPKAMAAVAAVINNRAVKEGKTPEQVVKERNQFEGYSNPGSASVKAQNNPDIVARAAKVWDGITSGTLADPTNGGTMFHASYVSPGWADSANKHGTVNIGGNIFYKGSGASAPATALEAIDKAVPLPVPRPTVASAFTAPATQSSLTDILGQRYQSSAPSESAASSYAGILPSSSGLRAQDTPPLPRPRPEPTLTSRSVNTVPVDPATGNPMSSQQQLQVALEAYAAKRAASLTPFVSEDHPRSNAVVPPPKVTFFSTPQGPAPTQFQQTNPIGSLFNAPAAPASSLPSGSIKTTSAPAGSVGLPPGVVPGSAARDLAAIVAQQANVSGSPDDRQSAPTPMPSRPTFSSGSPDIIKNVPYVPPVQPHVTDASNPLDYNRLGLSSSPPVQAIQKQVLNPAYTEWQASQTPPLKAGQAYTATGAIIPQSMADAMRAVPSSSYMRPVTPAPPKFITRTIPAPTVRSVMAGQPSSGGSSYPAVSAALVNIASGKTVPVGTTGTAQGGAYSYAVQPDGSVLNTTTGRTTAPAPGAPQTPVQKVNAFSEKPFGSPFW